MSDDETDIPGESSEHPLPRNPETGAPPAPGREPGSTGRHARRWPAGSRPFLASVGSIVFGMEDGTVSIFGLVFGVAASVPDSRAVLLAGGTGAVAAAVSMMAGTFLDVESTDDQAAARVADARARYEADPGLQDSDVHRRLVTAGPATPRPPRSPASSASIRKLASSSRPASTWGQISRPGRVPSCSRYGCSSPTCLRRRSRSYPSPCSAWRPRGSSRCR